MKTKLTALLLMIIIVATVGGLLAVGESEGLIHVSDPLRAMGGRIPWVGAYVAPSAAPPLQELAELERLQEEKAREEKWAQLKKMDEMLKTAETSLNTERQRLSQWESELERRELALTDREKVFTDREKQLAQQVKSYLSMKPLAAAKILAQQEDLLVVELFRRMPERNVAAILAEMDPTAAGTIMRKMAR